MPANYCLLQKELSGLKLILWLVVAICVLECCYINLTGFPDMSSVTDRATAEDDSITDTIANLLLFGILIGAYLFAQEREHKTLPFLDGLPVKRWTLFIHKLMAGCLAMAIVVIGLRTFGLFFEWLERDSLSPPVPWYQPIMHAAVMFLLGCTIVGVSTLVSFARRWFPLIAGLIILTIVMIRSSESWLAAWLDSPLLLRWSLDDNHAFVPWKPIIGHLLIGAIGWIGAWIGFQARDGFVSRQIERMSQWRLASWLVALSQLAATGVWLSVILFIGSDGDSDDTVETLAAGKIHGQPSSGAANDLVGFGRSETQAYEVVFRESQREEVDRCIGWLDELDEQVRKFFGDPPRPAGKMVLDTASPVMSHVSAQTNWTKIRVPLALMEDDLDFCRTVRHETAHVYIEQLSGGRARDQFNAMRMFHEGVSSLAELADDLESDSVPRLQKERWAAGVDSRGRVPFQILCDDRQLTSLRDPNIVYPLGFIVAQAMIDAGGPTLPRRFLEALRTTSFPPGAKSIEIWRILLQKCNSSLDLVIAHYESRLDALAAREPEYLNSLPRLEAKVKVESDSIIIQVTPILSSSTSSGATSATHVCQFERNRLITKLPESIPQTAPGEFRLPRSTISGNKLRLLVGWRTPTSQGIIFEPWQEVELEK